jgi:hypothetical protein
MGNPNAPIFDAKELLEPLNIMHESLVYGGYSDVADGLLVDIIRCGTNYSKNMSEETINDLNANF